MMAGVKLVHVPYTGNPYSDLIAGQVQMMFSPIPASIAYVGVQQLRPLAVGTPTRLQVLPDLPTVAETLPGYDASGWHGIGAPKNTPAEWSQSSTRRSTPTSPIAASRPVRRTRRHADARSPASSAKSSPPRPRNGPR